MVLTMTKVVLNVIASGGKDIVPLVFMFPPGAASMGNWFDLMVIQR
jgi:hypothetical protein